MHHANLHITPSQYAELFEIQEGCCAICGRHQSSLNEKLCVDHNHETGEARGLLCHRCNIGIGYFQDDPALLSNAITYLQKDDTGIYLSENPFNHRWLKREGLSRSGHGDWRYVDKEDVSNLSVPELIEKYRVSRSTAYQWKQKLD